MDYEFDNKALFGILIFILVLIVLYGGEPDLMEAIIERIRK